MTLPDKPRAPEHVRHCGGLSESWCKEGWVPERAQKYLTPLNSTVREECHGVQQTPTADSVWA